MLRTLPPLFALLLMAAPAAGQAISNGFPFSMSPYDSTGAAFMPAFPIEPIGGDDFISAVGDDFHRNGAPIRFWGANFVADGAFPTHEESDFLAGRYRNMGFNLARFHHIDNPWSSIGIFPRNGSTREIDEVQRDRLEYLVYKLKQEGVYVNMNLHVSRTFTEADGVAGAESIPDFGKGVTLFDPYLIELQKEYATQILGHVNPYTGLALADDPVLAMVEIANENSLYFMWRNGDLTGFADGGKLLTRHVVMLDDLWTQYLRQKYASTEALREAWSADAKAEGLEKLIAGGFETSSGGRWQLEYHGGAQASYQLTTADAYTGSRSAEVTVATKGTEDWRVQFKQTGVSLERDTTYTVRFAARAERERTIGATVGKNVDPWTSYASFNAAVGTDWRTFEFTFSATEDVRNDARVSFILGGETGSVWIDDVSMRRAGRTAMDAAESLEDGTVVRLPFSEVLRYATPRMRDMTAFYIDLQDRYFAEMMDFLRNEVGVRVPLSSTNWNFGIADLAVQHKADYADNHAYWDHPSFPNVPWSPTDWTINNTAMVQSEDGGTIGRLMAGVAPADKPYTISEYNHSFPNRFQSEGVLALGAYSAFQDVDGIMFFEYNGGSAWTENRIGGYFTIHRNPAMMALMPSMARAYREGLIAEADATVPVRYAEEDVLEYPASDNGAWGGSWMFPPTLALRHRVVTETFAAASRFDEETLPDAPDWPIESDNRQIRWDDDGLMSVVAPRFIGFTGQLDRFEGTEFDFVILEEADGFATVTWVPVGDQLLFESGRSLLTIVSTAQNTAMGWDGTTTVHNDWGRVPAIIEARRLVLRLHFPVTTGGSNAGYLLVHVIDEFGEVAGTTRVDPTADGFVLELDQTQDETAWYGIEAFINPSSNDEQPDAGGFSLDTPFPNPTNDRLHLPVTVPSAAWAEVIVFDLLGRRIARDRTFLQAGSNSVTFNASTWSAGLYHVQVRSGIHVATTRFVKR